MRVGDLVQSVYPYDSPALGIISQVEDVAGRAVFSVVHISGPFTGCEMSFFESDLHVHYRGVAS
jgi:hypothetical protein